MPSPSRQMGTPGLELSLTLANVDGQVQDLFRALSSGFQKLDKVKDPIRQSKQLEELTVKMREAKRCYYFPLFTRDVFHNLKLLLLIFTDRKFDEEWTSLFLRRLIKDFDREMKEEESNSTSEQNKQLNEKKQALIKELNSYVALRKTYTSALGGGRNELLDGGGSQGERLIDEGAKLASTMTNQELLDTGRKQMDETDQTLERSKKVVQDTVNIGEETALTLKSQTEQMGRIVNELDTIQFSLKKASQLVKEISRQLATDKCIMAFLLLIVCGVIAIIVVKVVNPKNKDIASLPGLAPPATTTTNRRLLLALLE